jgi:hypothetical protein
MDLKDVVLRLAGTASKILVQDGMVLPLAFLLDADGGIAGGIVLDFSSQEAKEASVSVAQAAARKMGCPIAYVTEAWMSRHPKPDVAPSEDPDREEVIIVAAFGPNSTAAALVWFSRDADGTPVLSQPKLVEHQLESWMDPWPDRKPAH